MTDMRGPGGFGAHEARALLPDLYGVDGSVTPLPGDLDDNFAVVEPDGSRSVLKVMHADASVRDVELQVTVLRHLARARLRLAVPDVLPTSPGDDIGRVQDRDGRKRLVWRSSWLFGRPLSEVAPRSEQLLEHLGASLGELDRALADFSHPAAGQRHLRWDPARAGWLSEEVSDMADPELRRLVREVTDRLGHLDDLLKALPLQVIHADANDHNLLVDEHPEPTGVVGLFDFGDLIGTRRVCEPAIASAYAAFGSSDPVGVAARLARGYHLAFPLTPPELDAFVPLMAVRLAISLLFSDRRRRERPGDAYMTVSEDGARTTLALLLEVHPRLAAARLRRACGFPVNERAPAVESWLDDPERDFAPVLGEPRQPGDWTLIDLSVGSLMLGANPTNLRCEPCGQLIEDVMRARGARVGVGRWNEARAIYLGPAFAAGDHAIDEHRTIHIGVDLFAPAGTPVHAPLDAVVASAGENPEAGDYGPVILLEHRTDEGDPFWTLYGHLDGASLDGMTPGRAVAAGELFAALGAPPINGDWPPHLHLQLVLDPLDRGHDVPGVAAPREREVWTALSPDPSRLAGLPAGAASAPRSGADELLERRRRHLGPNLSVSYRRSLHLVRGWRQLLYDADGRGYIDLYNNVAHVGHSHPVVAEAVARQTALLATNTRYLDENLLRYMERLTATLPPQLEVGWVLNSASEANELALRLARAHTGRRDVIVLEAGYHGHTTTLIDVSAYKFAGPGGEGAPPWVRVAPLPDTYRGPFRRDVPDAGPRYGAAVGDVIDDMVAVGRPPGAFLAETFPSVGGQIVPPDGYLRDVYRRVRAAGGVCIADEVQTGFGRLGEAFWGFEIQDVAPDVVVLGKPAANGFPLGVVVTTRAIAESFDTGMEFFSTFGGNPVACAAGLAVLQVLEDEGLQENARTVGARLRRGLQELRARHPLLGDVRGMGLFQGIELVRESDALEPAAREARYVVDRLRERGVLTGTDGPFHNVVKLRGPLVLEPRDVDRFLGEVDAVLHESPLRR